MGEWSSLGVFFESLQAHSPMLGRFWLLLMLVFRILILGTVASDLFEDEQEEFACNTLQPGCKQVCYDMAFPISQYRFWVFHIVLIATPSLVFLMYTVHHDSKRTGRPASARLSSEDYRRKLRLRVLYFVHVAFRIVAEVGFLVGQWFLYGFKVEAQFPCSRFPCPYTVDCFTSRPAEKTVFLCFYFIVGVVAAFSSILELFYGSAKTFCQSRPPPYNMAHVYNSENLKNLKHEEEEEKELETKQSGKTESLPSSIRVIKGRPLRSSASRKVSGIGHKPRGGKYVNSRTFMV